MRLETRVNEEVLKFEDYMCTYTRFSYYSAFSSNLFSW